MQVRVAEENAGWVVAPRVWGIPGWPSVLVTVALSGVWSWANDFESGMAKAQMASPPIANALALEFIAISFFGVYQMGDV